MAAVAMIIAAFSSDLGAGPLDRDHHQAYRLHSVGVNESVLLQGQFESDFVAARLDSVVGFTNAVAGNSGSLIRRNLHYIWYRLHEANAEPSRKVILRNQFGEQTWTLGNPAYLLVPATVLTSPNQPDPLPDSADHYKCYRVLSHERTPGLPSSSLTLTDVWWRRIASVRIPTLFAVPVRKRRGEVASVITDGATHYAIYALEPKTSRARTLHVKDQFAARTVVVEQARALLVPSEKLSWGAVQRPTSPDSASWLPMN